MHGGSPAANKARSNVASNKRFEEKKEGKNEKTSSWGNGYEKGFIANLTHYMTRVNALGYLLQRSKPVNFV